MRGFLRDQAKEANRQIRNEVKRMAEDIIADDNLPPEETSHMD